MKSDNANESRPHEGTLQRPSSPHSLDAFPHNDLEVSIELVEISKPIVDTLAIVQVVHVSASISAGAQAVATTLPISGATAIVGSSGGLSWWSKLISHDPGVWPSIDHAQFGFSIGLIPTITSKSSLSTYDCNRSLSNVPAETEKEKNVLSTPMVSFSNHMSFALGLHPFITRKLNQYVEAFRNEKNWISQHGGAQERPSCSVDATIDTSQSPFKRFKTMARFLDLPQTNLFPVLILLLVCVVSIVCIFILILTIIKVALGRPLDNQAGIDGMAAFGKCIVRLCIVIHYPLTLLAMHHARNLRLIDESMSTIALWTTFLFSIGVPLLLLLFVRIYRIEINNNNPTISTIASPIIDRYRIGSRSFEGFYFLSKLAAAASLTMIDSPSLSIIVFVTIQVFALVIAFIHQPMKSMGDTFIMLLLISTRAAVSIVYGLPIILRIQSSWLRDGSITVAMGIQMLSYTALLIQYLLRFIFSVINYFRGTKNAEKPEVSEKVDVENDEGGIYNTYFVNTDFSSAPSFRTIQPISNAGTLKST